MVGDNVTITVLSVKGNQVRIGVKAPAEVAVHREEIYNRIHETGSVNQRSKPAQPATIPDQATIDSSAGEKDLNGKRGADAENND